MHFLNKLRFPPLVSCPSQLHKLVVCTCVYPTYPYVQIFKALE